MGTAAEHENPIYPCTEMLVSADLALKQAAL